MYTCINIKSMGSNSHFIISKTGKVSSEIDVVPSRITIKLGTGLSSDIIPYFLDYKLQLCRKQCQGHWALMPSMAMRTTCFCIMSDIGSDGSNSDSEQT